MKTPRIYLDNAATTRVAPEIVETMRPFFSEIFGNASSTHAFGREARDAIEAARIAVARLLDAEAAELVFTSGGTEADTFAAHLLARYCSRQGRHRIVSSAAEHHAVLAPLERLSREGYSIVMAPLLASAAADPEAAEALMTEETGAACLMHVNNETGGISDIARICTAAKNAGAFVHVDAVQSAGKLPVSSREIPFDTAAISAHKIHGPKGIGALFIRRGVDVDPLFPGGSQERGRRGGTENVALVVGFGAAAEIALREMELRRGLWRNLRGDFIARILHEYPEARVNGMESEVLPSILSISFPAQHYPMDGEMLVAMMDLEGVAVSSGSACTSGSVKASHVMSAIGHDTATAAATVRVSFGAYSTPDESVAGADALLRVLQRVIHGADAR